jgi:hypothetical protein
MTPWQRRNPSEIRRLNSRFGKISDDFEAVSEGEVNIHEARRRSRNGVEKGFRVEEGLSVRAAAVTARRRRLSRRARRD